MSSIKDSIVSRKSVRSFNGTKLSEEDLKKVEDIINQLDNPFSIPVEFKILDKNDNNVSSPVVTGENTYIAAKAAPDKFWEMGYGYEFEKLCLLLNELGIGTTILAATLKRKAFEDAMDLEGSEVMPATTPIGYPASKRTMREKLLRKAIKSDERLPFEELYFKEDFNTPITEKEAGDLRDALELMRWAPSAGNKQPWRAIIDGDTIHFYKDSTRSLGESNLGDVQKMDVGIALAHFDLARKEDNIDGEFVYDDPGIPTNEKTEYLISFKRS